MRNKTFQALIALLMSISFGTTAAAAPASGVKSNQAPEAATESSLSQNETLRASINRFLNQIAHPEPRTYRQILASMRSFVPGEFLDKMEKELGTQVDDQFPRYEFRDKGKSYDLVLSTGSQSATLKINKNNPKTFARFQNQVISHKEAQDAEAFLNKIKAGAESPSKKKSALQLLLIEEAHAFNYALFGGLAILGVGIAFGLSKLSKAKIKTEHVVDVKLPDKDIDVNVNFDIPRLGNSQK